MYCSCNVDLVMLLLVMSFQEVKKALKNLEQCTTPPHQFSFTFTNKKKKKCYENAYLNYSSALALNWRSCHRSQKRSAIIYTCFFGFILKKVRVWTLFTKAFRWKYFFFHEIAINFTLQ